MHYRKFTIIRNLSSLYDIYHDATFRLIATCHSMDEAKDLIDRIPA